MGPAWAYAFLAATFVTLAGTPLLRKLALATEFVDHPVAEHKSHVSPTPYLGGVGLIVAVLVGLLFTDRLTPQVAVVAVGGTLIGCLGLLDDHRSVGALFRFIVELAIAGVAVVAGLRIHATDVPAIDAMVTLIWIVGVTNAVNLLDNMDGLAAGVSAAAAAAIFALAVLGEQVVTATLAAGLAGACVGFLAHNKRPASIFMGDTGSLFLGFVLAVAAIDVSPALTPPASFLVPLMLLALPVLDTVTVTLARLRRGRSISQGGKDHLSHRLVARGLSPGTAVGVLIGAEAAVGLMALLAGRVVPLEVATLGTAAVLAALASVTLPAKVYSEPMLGLPRTLRYAAAAAVAGVVLLAAPATVALVRAHEPGVAGANAARDGLQALEAGDSNQAAVHFDRAAEGLARAEAILGGRLPSLGLLLPGLRANLATTRATAAAGGKVARSAASLSALAEGPTLPVGRGPETVRLSTRLSPALGESVAVLQRAVTELTGYDRPYLWPSLGRTVRDLRSSLLKASARAATAADVALLGPALLGEGEPRRYFVAVQDNRELRGGGGVIHHWGELTAEGGRLGLSRFGPVEELNGAGPSPTLTGMEEFLDRYRAFDPASTWQNVNVSPDFPVTAEVVDQLYPKSGGREVDGVIAVDLPGLAALAALAGPVQVDGWPTPVTGAALTDIVLHEAPRRFPEEAQRAAFVEELIRRTLETFVAVDLPSPAKVVSGLADAVQGGHLMLWSGRAEEEALFERLGVAGRVPDLEGDSLLVVNQNLTATDVDSQLRRQIRYQVRLDPGREPASLTARAEVTLRNDAVAENRTYLSVYSLLALPRPPPGVQAADELGRRAYSASVTIPGQQSRTVTLDVEGRMELAADKWYRLELGHQASLAPDDVHVSLSVPRGWRIAEVAGGMRTVDDRHAVAELGLSSPAELSVRLERTPWSRLWARIGS